MRTAFLLVLLASACAAPNERLLYRMAIEEFADAIPKGEPKCWVTPDRNGGTGSANIAEEVITNYLMETKTCRVIEKHTDVLGGFMHPSSAQTSENAPVPPPSAPAPAGPAGALGGLLGGGGGAAVAGIVGAVYDGNLSEDILVERHKKRMAQKVLIFRIDELEPRKAVIHFRLSDEATGMVESSATIPVEQEAPKREGGRRK